MRRTLIILILVIAAFGIVAARQAQPTPNTPNPQSTDILDQTTAERGDLRLTVSATGVVVPNREVPLLFEATGVGTAVANTVAKTVKPGVTGVAVIFAGLLPIMVTHGTGSEVMQRIAAPMVGGMISSTVLTLAVIPAIYALVKQWRLNRGVE